LLVKVEAWLFSKMDVRPLKMDVWYVGTLPDTHTSVSNALRKSGPMGCGNRRPVAPAVTEKPMQFFQGIGDIM
jgi:hypothetical protein